jgi:cation:H+ antiporter
MSFEMNIIWASVLLVAGLVMLWKSADILVDGAIGLAKRLGISALVVGLTVVAMGTSTPEVAASIAAVLQKGGGDIAIGNVFGSNIANLALVGGLAALIRPIRVRKKILQREMPAMLLVALLLWPLLGNLSLSRPEGVLLLAVFSALIFVTVYMAQKESKNKAETIPQTSGQSEKSDTAKPLKTNILFVIIGLVGLTVGAKMVVTGAVFVGRKVGLSEGVIGLTIIAFGTSLPELVTCVVAAVKGHHDISIGNLVGSNIFNTLLVTGAASMVRPFEVAKRFAGGADYWIMIIVSGVFLLMALAGRRISRTNGTILFCGYVAYIVYLLAFST